MTRTPIRPAGEVRRPRPPASLPRGLTAGLALCLAVLVLAVLVLVVTTRSGGPGSPATRPPGVQHPGAGGRAADPAAPAIDWPGDGQAAYTTSLLPGIRTSGAAGPVPIASVTKVMTAYLVLRAAPLRPGEEGPTLTMTQADADDAVRRRQQGESVVPVVAGERLTELEALEALLLPSANNMAVVLARFSAGSVDAFVDRMNEAAAGLGMTGTHYTEPSGIDAATVSTAADQLVLFTAALADPVLASVTGTTTATLPVAGTVTNTDTLLGRDGFTAGKTGSHAAAGGCLVFRAVRQVDGRAVTITGVVLGQRDGPLVPAALTAAERLVDAVAGSADARR